MHNQIDVIATTISGSISDWGKIERIVPEFNRRGWSHVNLHSADSHAEARNITRQLVLDGTRTLISAGGSGTFNSVLEGCIDSGAPLSQITLGFLRKGSADLIGKTLGMPDEIEQAIAVFVNSLEQGFTQPCDVIRITSDNNDTAGRHFVGYSGAGIFGRIPHFTENRFMKYYKGILSQLFGDLGPFFVGAALTTGEKVLHKLVHKPEQWKIMDGNQILSRGKFQAMIIVNGDLGPDLPFARGKSLGSGSFYLFAIRDLGILRLPGQFRRAWNSSIQEQAEQWGFESFSIREELVISKDDGAAFPVNVDGSTLICQPDARFRIIDQIRLISAS
ncbi:diacylglycerol/lipid kinase family protein [Amphritea sp. HPY]|uniref:diacylglycerol/lipid kinase family protein n=1 Tax=Amphritea sp. HPY TaxID=3421652 RepID=UPI003D7E4B39